MRTIWKQVLHLGTGIQDISFPAGSEIFAAGLDPSGVICVWARVDSSMPIVTHQVGMFWTGEEMSQLSSLSFQTHIGTFNMGGLIYHVFVK